jgi:hypothetical protein
VYDRLAFKKTTSNDGGFTKLKIIFLLKDSILHDGIGLVPEQVH